MCSCFKNIEILEKEALFNQSEILGQKLLDSLEELLTHPNVGDIRGKGLLLGIELVKDKITKTPIDSEKSNGIVKMCKEKGLLVGKNSDTVSGYDNVIQLAPPLSITTDDLDFIINTLKESIKSL